MATCVTLPGRVITSTGRKAPAVFGTRVFSAVRTAK